MTTAPNGEWRRQDFHPQVQQLVSLRSLPSGQHLVKLTMLMGHYAQTAFILNAFAVA